MNKKQIGFLLSAVVFATSLAATFPNAGGDLAGTGADGWNGQLPGTSEIVQISQSGTYTLSDDATFGCIEQTGKAVVFDFTSGNKTLTLSSESTATGSGGSSVFCFPYSSKTISTTLKGGVWYSSASKPFNFVGLGNSNSWKPDYNHYTFVVTNGCIITNVSGVTVGNRIANFKATLADHSKIYSTGEVRVADSGGTNVVLEIASGSELHCGGVLRTDCGTSVVAKYAGIDVHGAGSLLDCPSGNGTQVGFKTSCNFLRVRDGALYKQPAAVALSQTATSTGNRFEVLNLATAEVADVIFQYDGANTLLVSNATLKTIGKITIGSDSSGFANNRVAFLDGAKVNAGGLSVPSCGNEVVFSGATTEVKGFKRDFFDNGFANTLVFSDGYTYNYVAEGGGDFQFCRSSNNVFRVTRNAVFDNSTPGGGSCHTYLGYSSKASVISNCVNNLLEISDGAQFKNDRFFVYGFDNRVVVSNATLSAGAVEGAERYGVWIGYSSTSSNVGLCLQGSTPAVRCLYGSPFIAQHKSVIRWEIPEGGYADGYVPMTAQSFIIQNNSRFEIACAEWAAVRGFGRRELVLLRSENNLGGDVQAAVAAVTGLPEGVKLFVRGTDVVLSSKSTLGSAIILR